MDIAWVFWAPGQASALYGIITNIGVAWVFWPPGPHMGRLITAIHGVAMAVQGLAPYNSLSGGPWQSSTIQDRAQGLQPLRADMRSIWDN